MVAAVSILQKKKKKKKYIFAHSVKILFEKSDEIKYPTPIKVCFQWSISIFCSSD